MITINEVNQEILLAESDLQRIRVRSLNGNDYMVTTNDAKRVAIKLYEFLCKFQGQEER